MKAHHHLNRQAGATLIVALVFLVVLTAAGITAMRFATNNERMASSNQFRNTAYQQGQTEIRAQLIYLNILANRLPLMSASEASNATASDEPNATIRSRFPNLKAYINLTARTTQNDQSNSLRSMGIPDCAIFGKGYSFDMFTCRQYEISGTSSFGGATSNQTQGLIYFAPK